MNAAFRLSKPRLLEVSVVDLLISFNPMEYGEYAETYFELAEKMTHSQLPLRIPCLIAFGEGKIKG